MDPKEHRVLLMLPTVYRLSGKTRLRHLEPCVAEWAVEEICAGVGGQGAEDAAYATAVLIENIQVLMLLIMITKISTCMFSISISKTYKYLLKTNYMCGLLY